MKRKTKTGGTRREEVHESTLELDSNITALAEDTDDPTQGRKHYRDDYCETNRDEAEYRYLLEVGKVYMDWLATGGGVFHVSGKLGSGKSTLMKFLLKHPRTKSELLEWSGTD
jgi:ABC-type glutathione transport system ATPase component